MLMKTVPYFKKKLKNKSSFGRLQLLFLMRFAIKSVKTDVRFKKCFFFHSVAHL